MAKNVLQKHWNGTSWDEIHPITKAANVIANNGQSVESHLAETVKQTTANVTYYVRTDGNDGNNGLANTVGGAFRTIQKAINAIPQVVNHAVNVEMATGAYGEIVSISGLSGKGSVTLNPSIVAVGDLRTTTNVIVSGCTVQVVVKGIKALTITADAFVAVGSSDVQFLYCKTDGASINKAGVSASGSNVYIYECLISNKGFAIYAGLNCNFWSFSNVGTGNNIGIQAAGGAKVAVTGYQSAANIPYAADSGGIVNDRGVINPWGDNTRTSRPASRAYASGSVQQSLSANVWTKVQFPQENVDNLGNYDPALSRFTVTQEGIYQINANVLFSTGSSVIEMFLYVNEVGYRRLDYKIAPSGFSDTCVGSASVLLYPGNLVEIYVRSSTNNLLSLGYDCNFEVVRIA